MNKDAKDDETINFEDQQADYENKIGGNWENFKQLYLIATEFAIKLSALGWLAASPGSVSTLRVSYITYAYTMGYDYETINKIIEEKFKPEDDRLGCLTQMIEAPVQLYVAKTVKAWTKRKLNGYQSAITDPYARCKLATLFQHEFLTGQCSAWLRLLFSKERQTTLQGALGYEWGEYMKYLCSTQTPKEEGEALIKCSLFQKCDHNDVNTKVGLFLEKHKKKLLAAKGEGGSAYGKFVAGKGKDGEMS